MTEETETKEVANEVNYVRLKKNENSYIQYSKDNNFLEELPLLPAGIYKPSDVGGMFETRYCFEKVEITENLIRFNGGSIGNSLRLIDDFYSDKIKQGYEDLGVAHKMGLIFYGPPGTGKTCSSLMIMTNVATKYDAICLDCTVKKLSFIINVIKHLRVQQPNRPIIIFYDEVEDIIRHDESGMLKFLDGTDSVDGVVFIGCTNNLEKIPDRIKNRRSRIKHCILVKSLPTEVYRQFITEKAKRYNTQQVEELAFFSEEQGLSIDELKHALIDTYIHGVDMATAVTEVKKYAIATDE